MHKYTIALAAGVGLLAGACTDNPAAPSTDRVVSGGAPQSLQTLLTGVVASDRNAAGLQSYYAFGDIWARDAIRPDGNDPRYIGEFFEAQPDPSDFIGRAQWTNYYVALRAANSLLVDPSLTSLPSTDKNAAVGFLQTDKGHDYLNLIEMHDVNGIVIQGPDPTKLDPILTKPNALKAIVAVLDSGYSALTAAGDAASVPFALPAGYSLHGDYSKVVNLKRYNRGLAGKAEVYLALANASSPDLTAAAAAKTALDAALAGVTPSASSLQDGPYFEFLPGAPDLFPNPLPDAKLALTVNFVSSMDPNDARKAQIIPAEVQSVQGYSSAPDRLAITDPLNQSNATAPLPILRNAELYLLRAQAEIALGDLASATADINVVHTIEGGLPAYPTFTSASAAIQAVLYEYRYSFILQGPQHLVALREYGLLNQSYVSQPGIPTPGAASDALVQRLPIPQTEADARGGDITPH